MSSMTCKVERSQIFSRFFGTERRLDEAQGCHTGSISYGGQTLCSRGLRATSPTLNNTNGFGSKSTGG